MYIIHSFCQEDATVIHCFHICQSILYCWFMQEMLIRVTFTKSNGVHYRVSSWCKLIESANSRHGAVKPLWVFFKGSLFNANQFWLHSLLPRIQRTFEPLTTSYIQPVRGLNRQKSSLNVFFFFCSFWFQITGNFFHNIT